MPTEASFTAQTTKGSYPSVNTVLDWYAVEAGWDPTLDYPFAEAFCLWRTSIISQGIAARNARGQASSAEAQSYGQKMFPLGELAWLTVERCERKRAKDRSKL